jgi:hypothetical protein
MTLEQMGRILRKEITLGRAADTAMRTILLSPPNSFCAGGNEPSLIPAPSALLAQGADNGFGNLAVIKCAR